MRLSKSLNLYDYYFCYYKIIQIFPSIQFLNLVKLIHDRYWIKIKENLDNC